MATEYRTIGKPTPRVEGVDKVTGAAPYVADRTLPGMLWARVLHSSSPHALITRIDTEAAKALPGVHAVITGDDVRGPLYGRRIKDIPVLAGGRVRFFGERVAAVAAETESIAEEALKLIEVEYEELPPIYDFADALADGAPLLHPDFATYAGGKEIEGPGNAYARVAATRGDPDAGFADADLIIENTYRTQRQHQVYLEPHASIVDVSNGRVEVWTNTKAPYAIKEALAGSLGLGEDDVLLHHSYIGGDFGGKGTPLDLPIAYFLAKVTGRPVKIVADYLEEFLAGQPRHATETRLRTGVKRDGTITAHEVQVLVNCGAYAGYKPNGAIGGANYAAGPYRVANTRLETVNVYTNTVPGGHMRAPGAPQGVFALESHIDEVARALAMDPVAFRMQNLIVQGEETAYGEQLIDVKVRETLQAAVEAGEYATAKQPYVGRGVAIGDRSAGGGQGSASVTFGADGSVVLGTPIFDQGSGTYTTLQQVVAEELEMDPEQIRVEIWNTDGAENDSGIGGSRGSRVATPVAKEAAIEGKRALLEYASTRLEHPVSELTLKGEEILVAGEAEGVRWAELVSDAREPISGRAEVEQAGPSHITGFAAQVAEVSVDPETGEVTILRFTSAHDVGRVLNPVGHQGQINGGFMQGLGYALMEELPVEDGQVTSLSFGEYKIPSMGDIPPLKTVLVESDTGVGPYAIKGIGENSVTSVAPAIANAVEDAIGVRIRDLPITAEKIYRALKERA